MVEMVIECYCIQSINTLYSTSGRYKIKTTFLKLIKVKVFVSKGYIISSFNT